MRHSPFIAITLLSLAGCGKEPPAPPLPPPTGSAVAPDDTTRIQGLWTAATIRKEESQPEEIPNNVTLLFENGGYTLNLPPDDTEVGRFTLLTQGSPRQIDLVRYDGELRRGVYMLDGDKLTICVSDQTNALRPAEFKAGTDANRASVMTFTRTK